MDLKFRTLKANEIDCRIATINDRGLTLLLYKDARVDQNILDETVGAMNWQRHHTRDNANCIVAIWDDEKKQWIEKEDTGTESFTEKEKGLASDSFKRACFNWGIGRELYSAPFIWISSDYATIKQGNNGKMQCYDKFIVEQIAYDDDRNITALVIVNANTKGKVYQLGKQAIPNNKLTDEKYDIICDLIAITHSDEVKMCEYFKVKDIRELTATQANKCIKMLESKMK